MTDHSRRLLEFADGYLEVLPMPTVKHQAISQFVFLAFLTFIQRIGGKVQYAPLRLQIRPCRRVRILYSPVGPMHTSDTPCTGKVKSNVSLPAASRNC
jgi:hypothetical protein